MARVFLSYAREDLKRARSVASALDKAGHSVWWDRQLVGGSEYSTAIDAALADADAVVVLWSKASVASPWVRDEAAKARDTGRLVPASIDGAEPPLGFRQFHTIDLSRRSGRTELVSAVGGKATTGAKEGLLEDETSASLGRTAAFRPLVLLAALVALLAIGFLGWRLAGPGSPPDRELALAVMPFADMSPARDQAALAEGVAEEIMTLVSGTPGIRVIGRTSAWQLAKSGDLAELRKRLGATHLLEGSVRSSGGELRIGSRLIDTATGEELWSEEYRRPRGDIFAIQEDIGGSVAQRLRGTVAAAREGRKVRSIRTSPEVYDLYLAARAVGRRRDYESQLQAEQLLEQAIAIDPDYAPAHAFLAVTLEVKDNQNPEAQDANRPEDNARALRHAERAVELEPRHAEGHVAIGMVLMDDDPEAALRALGRGKELDPGNFYAWNISGNLLNRLCRYRDSAADFERAVEIEPLLFVAYFNLESTLRTLARDAEAKQLIARFSANGADPRAAHAILGQNAYWSGALAGSFREWEAYAAAGGQSPQLKNYLGHLLLRFGRTEDGIKTFPESRQGLVGSYWRRDYTAAANAVASIGPDVWTMPYLPAAAANAMVHAGKNPDLVKLVESHWGSIDMLLSDRSCPLQTIGAPLVLALRTLGRPEDAQRVLDASAQEHRFRVRNGLANYERHTDLAPILVLRGRHDEAISQLERAASMGWVNQGEPYWVGLSDPVFVPLRSHPRFLALLQQIARSVEQEKLKLATRGAVKQ